MKARKESRKLQGTGINLLRLSSERDPSQQQWEMGPARKHISKPSGQHQILHDNYEI